MNGIKSLILITNRELSENYVEFFNKQEFNGVLSYLGTGTAKNDMLDYLGIEKSEKVIFNLMVPTDRIDELKKKLIKEMKLSSVGAGIAVFLPVDALGGNFSKNILIGDLPLVKGEKTDMENNLSKLVLLVTIVNKGHTLTVMDAARDAGATGGTIIKAKGTGADIPKFFGVSISSEKEMLYIVAKRSIRDEIMHAIMDKAGKDTPAQAVIFSLPVDDVCGIGAIDD